jgi:hypothetical protein
MDLHEAGPSLSMASLEVEAAGIAPQLPVLPQCLLLLPTPESLVPLSAPMNASQNAALGSILFRDRGIG